MKYNCFICGHSFEKNDKMICPICGNNDENYILKYIEINDSSDNSLFKERIKFLLDRKSHSAAYIKLCSKKLFELGYFELAKELEKIANDKLSDEAMLLELFGVKDDIRLNLDNIMKKAIEDYNLSKELSKLEKLNENEKIYDRLYEMKINEENNINLLSYICKNICNDKAKI